MSPDSEFKLIEARPTLRGIVRLPGFLSESTVQILLSENTGGAFDVRRRTSIGRKVTPRGAAEQRLILPTYAAASKYLTMFEVGAIACAW